jgi:hypothetical protein
VAAAALAEAGPLLVHLSAQPEHCSWDTLGLLGGLSDKTAQVELGSGKCKPLAYTRPLFGST